MTQCKEGEILSNKKKRPSLSLCHKPLSEKLVIAQGCQPPTKRFIETCDDEVHLSRKSQVVRTPRDLSCGPLMCLKNGLSSMLKTHYGAVRVFECWCLSI